MRAHAKAKVMALYLSQGIDEGGKSVASHPGYHADAMTSEGSVALLLSWIPLAEDVVALRGLRAQYCPADTSRGVNTRRGTEFLWNMEEETRRKAKCVSGEMVLWDQERLFRMFERLQATWFGSSRPRTCATRQLCAAAIHLVQDNYFR